MTEALRFDGKVVIVTGAGGSLGKSYALEFARRGAKVIVNDLGGSLKGEGQNLTSGNATVDEIRALGGICVPNYDSVENGQNIVKTAIDAYGRIDIVINNAGILRDQSLAKISNDDWELVQKVHLKGSFSVSQAAWTHMKKQKFGRIIMTSSPSALYGSFGQANYASAKGGLIGLSNTLAVEGLKYNINVNAICPSAYSRMTDGILPKDALKLMHPDSITPLVVWLCHDTCKENGGVYEATGGVFTKLSLQKGAGYVMTSLKDGPEQLRDNFTKVKSLAESVVHTTSIEQIGDSLKKVTFAKNTELIETLRAGGDPRKCIGIKQIGQTMHYNEDDAILYALSVGVGAQDSSNARFLNERHPDFCVLPGYASAVYVMSSQNSVQPYDGAHAIHLDHSMELSEPLPRSGTLIVDNEYLDIVDKKSAAIYISSGDLSIVRDGHKVKIGSTTNNIYLRGKGGFGGNRTSKYFLPAVNPPKREPDAQIIELIDESQAALYRLTGDHNPIHIDENAAKRLGFKKPILHGLCSMGVALKHVMSRFAFNDLSLFKGIKVKFSSIVLPGQHMKTSMWKVGTRIHFICSIVETDKVCLSGAYVDLFREPNAALLDIANINSNALNKVGIHLQNNKDVLLKAVNNVFVIKLCSETATFTYTLDAKVSGTIYEGMPLDGRKADLCLEIDAEKFEKLITQKISLHNELFNGSLRLSYGEMLKLNNLSKLFAGLAKL